MLQKLLSDKNLIRHKIKFLLSENLSLSWQTHINKLQEYLEGVIILDASYFPWLSVILKFVNNNTISIKTVQTFNKMSYTSSFFPLLHL